MFKIMLISFQYQNFYIQSEINLSIFLRIFLTQIFISRRRNYKGTTSWLLWDSIIISLPIKMLSILYPPVPLKCRTVVSKTAVCTVRHQEVWHSLNSLHNENHTNTLQGYKAYASNYSFTRDVNVSLTMAFTVWCWKFTFSSTLLTNHLLLNYNFSKLQNNRITIQSTSFMAHNCTLSRTSSNNFLF